MAGGFARKGVSSMNNQHIELFSTPLEDYSKAVRKIKTLADVRDIQEKYAMFLDDAEPCFESINERTFEEFKSELSRAYRNGKSLSGDWFEKYGAIVLPALFLTVGDAMALSNMSSGLVMNVMLNNNRAVIENGKFKLLGGK